MNIFRNQKDIIITRITNFKTYEKAYQKMLKHSQLEQRCTLLLKNVSCQDIIQSLDKK